MKSNYCNNVEPLNPIMQLSATAGPVSHVLPIDHHPEVSGMLCRLLLSTSSISTAFGDIRTTL
jgi:hypothetical protein